MLRPWSTSALPWGGRPPLKQFALPALPWGPLPSPLFASDAVALPSALPWQKSALVLVDFPEVLFSSSKTK